MKSCLFICLFSCFTSTIISSQNLIPNGSFELTKKEVDDRITIGKEDFNQKAHDWYSPTDASPDIYKVSIDNDQRPPNFRLPKPPDGKGLAGIILNTVGSRPDCRHYKEYIQIKLKTPLEIGETYLLSFWIYGTTTGHYEISTLLSDKAIYTLNCNPLKESSQIIYNDRLNKEHWKQMAYGFKATAASTYMTIGNFSEDNTKRQIYCYLDDFHLATFNPEDLQAAKKQELLNVEKTEEKVSPVVPQLPSKKIFNPSNIHFEHGSAQLTQSALTELDKLVLYLQQEIDLSLLIEGHTDNSGTASFNQVLSIERASSVKRYLSSKGITDMRLKAIGYGAGRPIASPDTAAGAQKNRRVVFRMMNVE